MENTKFMKKKFHNNLKLFSHQGTLFDLVKLQTIFFLLKKWKDHKFSFTSYLFLSLKRGNCVKGMIHIKFQKPPFKI